MKALVVANWKMHPSTFREAKKLLEETKKAAEKYKVPVVVAPPSIFVRELVSTSRGKRVAFAVQHAHFENEGAFTGEISIAHARDAHVTHVLIGHAERRARGETDEDIAKKVAAALQFGLTPIVCIGEEVRRPGGEYFAQISTQLRTALGGLPSSHLSRVLIVYEPLWTIGADHAMSPHEMHQMSIFIRKTVVDMHGDIGLKMKILYGGSLNAENTLPMLQDGDIHGLLVGRACLDTVEFTKLLKAVSDA